MFCFQELEDLKKSQLRTFRNIEVEESNILNWTGVLVPVSNIKAEI